MSAGGLIGRAHPAHAGWLAVVHQAACPDAETWSAAAFAGQLGLPGVFGLMHSGGGLVLARVAADEAEILTLAVVPDLRRRGVARALLQAAHRRMEQSGAHAGFLEVSETNAAARGLYESLGYRPAGRRRAYYADGTDALILRLTLGRGGATAP